MANLVRIIKNFTKRKNYNFKLERKAHLSLILNTSKQLQIKRITNICILTGAGKSVYRHTGFSRHMFKRYANQGYIMGFRKSSW